MSQFDQLNHGFRVSRRRSKTRECVLMNPSAPCWRDSSPQLMSEKWGSKYSGSATLDFLGKRIIIYWYPQASLPAPNFFKVTPAFCRGLKTLAAATVRTHWGDSGPGLAQSSRSASKTRAGPWSPLHAPYFAYKALNNKDALHIKHYIIRTLCKYSVLVSALLLYMRYSDAGRSKSSSPRFRRRARRWRDE